MCNEYKLFEIPESLAIDVTENPLLYDLSDPGESSEPKSWTDRMHEHYRDGGDITEFFEDLVGTGLASGLSPSILVNIYCFLHTLHDFPDLLQPLDPDTLEDAAFLTQELLERMNLLGIPT